MISRSIRGFIFGDGIYEVIPAYGHASFRLDEHLERLRQSLAGVRIDQPYTTNNGTASSTNWSNATRKTSNRSTCRSLAASPGAITPSRRRATHGLRHDLAAAAGITGHHP